MKKISGYMVFCIAALSFMYLCTATGNFESETLSGFILQTSDNDTDSKNLGVTYDINIPLSKSSGVKMNIYKRHGRTMSKEDAIVVAGLFGMKDFVEDEYNYYFAGDTAGLQVSKQEGTVTYKAYQGSTRADSGEIRDNEAAVTAAKEFIKSKQMPVNYVRADVVCEDGLYTVNFINTLEGKYNYTFAKTVVIDTAGTVRKMLYYDGSYEKVGQVTLISIAEAAEVLKKTDFGLQQGTVVDIKSCMPVYYSDENGGIMPYYRFVGELKSDGGFAGFVPAFF